MLATILCDAVPRGAGWLEWYALTRFDLRVVRLWIWEVDGRVEELRSQM